MKLLGQRYFFFQRVGASGLGANEQTTTDILFKRASYHTQRPLTDD